MRPIEHLTSFGSEYLDLLEAHGEQLAAAGPLPEEAHTAMCEHVAALLREIVPGIDVEYAAQTLVAALDAGLHEQLRHEAGWSRERLEKGWSKLLDAWLVIEP